MHSSALFMTGAAQNLLCLKLASELGVVIPNTFLTWFKAALLPALVGLVLTPLILYQASPRPACVSAADLCAFVRLWSAAVHSATPPYFQR